MAHIIGHQVTGSIPKISKGPNGVIILIHIFFIQVSDIDGTVSTLWVGDGGAASHGSLVLMTCISLRVQVKF